MSGTDASYAIESGICFQKAPAVTSTRVADAARVRRVEINNKVSFLEKEKQNRFVVVTKRYLKKGKEKI